MNLFESIVRTMSPQLQISKSMKPLGVAGMAMGESKKTYISLFSCAGVGCYGFKLEGFECIATNELIPRRLNIQKYNHKCKYESGYICGDITLPETKQKLLDEVSFWRKKESIQDVTVVMATPPCQGMSVANHKKTDHEIQRNSLVIESIELIEKINPMFFLFENVPRFLKTLCIDNDEECLPISAAIEKHLGDRYSYYGQVINFKNYGSNSSRSRTIVIGVRSDYANYISPFELFPDYREEKTLRETIGELPRLIEYGQISDSDIYHAFRTYPEHMRTWIHDIKEGQSAFDNKDIEKKPHTIINGKIVVNVNKNGDKYTRQYWDKVGPCIHTRNDQLASQNTVHPEDDRVFSIRELMRLMSIPDTFKWTEFDESYLNSLPLQEKKQYLKKNETNIRQCLGEAVPTEVIHEIAHKISSFLENNNMKDTEILHLIEQRSLFEPEKLRIFLEECLNQYNYSTLSKIIELSNAQRVKNAAYFTDLSLITEIIKELPDSNGGPIHILEPSVGAGNFIPLIIKKYDNSSKIVLDLVDVDPIAIENLRIIISKLFVSTRVEFNFIVDDFLTHNFKKRYDIVIGNPPFSVVDSKNPKLKSYREQNVNKRTRNTFEFFIEKALNIGAVVSLVTPKTLVYAPEFDETRSLLGKLGLISIIDFGECGFKKVLVETINIVVSNGAFKSTHIRSIPQKIDIQQNIKYITDPKYPYWILYRNDFFDKVASKMHFGLFNCFRDRQITNAMLSDEGDIPVLRSRNMSDDGTKLISIEGYDKKIAKNMAQNLAVFDYLNRDDVYLTPNMTYYPRVMKKPKGILVNGSVAILVPKKPIKLSYNQMLYFSTEEYRTFYAIARNFQTRSLNIESNSVFFFGALNDGN